MLPDRRLRRRKNNCHLLRLLQQLFQQRHTDYFYLCQHSHPEAAFVRFFRYDANSCRKLSS